MEWLLMRWVVLTLLTGALAAGLALQGGVWPAEWNWCAGVVGVAGVLCWGVVRRAERAPEERWTVGLAVGLAGWMCVQMVPLPGWVVGVVSPARLEIARGLGETAWVTLSVSAAKTFEWILVFLPAVVTFLLAREMGWWWRGRAWVAAWPLVGLATVEAGLGLAQFYYARMAGGAAGPSVGTYVNRNHFAGFLEMGLPLAVAGALWAWRRGQHGGRAAVKAVALLGAAAAMVLAIVASQSRMGFLAALGSVAVMGLVALTATEGREEGGRRWVAGAALVAALAGLWVVYLPTDELIRRFAALAETEDISQDMRAEIWRETGRLIAAYPVAGAGLGTYESAFRRYKNVAPENTVDYAHNDYVQALAELGLVGFVLGLGLLIRVMGRALRVAVWHKESRSWELALGVVGTVTAMLLHSLTDFNMYIPANAMMLGWISGLGVGPGLGEGIISRTRTTSSGAWEG